MIGIPIKTDRYTMEKTFFKYARLLIDIPLSYNFPEYVEFANENDVLIRQQVTYEWQPNKCDHCHMYGHLEDNCRKKQTVRREWRVVQPTAETAQYSSKPQTPTIDEEGLIQVDKRNSILTHDNNPELSSSPNNFLALLNSEHDNAGLVHQVEGLDPNGLNKDKYHDLRGQQVKARAALEQVQQEFSSQPYNDELKQKEKEMRSHYISITSSVMDIIRQQSKAEWINFEDASTKYFFAKAKQRKLESYVYAIQDKKGELQQGFVEVSKVLQTYCSSLLGPSSPSAPLNPQHSR
ncbi:LOW QUALITY PROTEIN: hypothetical protein Cgig2_012371 [Carnegiea gigantea]|uniref:DUF4283 domain-containing protein n=1 Tax=Carnegiea gigantea TaxID=171969 RepID=A0A9Q1KNV0_9CARY|nr:LOW QUALITY PROTEIN: hypothetical protein Cgig2_012371 [Carnegiea gigantea]